LSVAQKNEPSSCLKILGYNKIMRSCDVSYKHLLAIGFYHLGYSCLEYWLGKTDKTKANSVGEFLALSLRDFFKRKEENG